MQQGRRNAPSALGRGFAAAAEVKAPEGAKVSLQCETSFTVLDSGGLDKQHINQLLTTSMVIGMKDDITGEREQRRF